MSISFNINCKNADITWSYIDSTIIWYDKTFDFNNPSYYYIYFLNVKNVNNKTFNASPSNNENRGYALISYIDETIDKKIVFGLSSYTLKLPSPGDYYLTVISFSGPYYDKSKCDVVFTVGPTPSIQTEISNFSSVKISSQALISLSAFMSASFNNVKYIMYFSLNNNSKSMQRFMLFYESVQDFTTQNYVKINFQLFKQFMKNYTQFLLIKNVMTSLQYTLSFETYEPNQLFITELFNKIYKYLNCKIKNNDAMIDLG